MIEEYRVPVQSPQHATNSETNSDPLEVKPSPTDSDPVRYAALGLPGGEFVDAGLADLAAERVTAASLLVSLAAPRLEREGVHVGTVQTDPEMRLYRLLSETEGGLAYARYNALLRQIVSFADALFALREHERRAS
jgi:hypothetical protein